MTGFSNVLHGVQTFLSHYLGPDSILAPFFSKPLTKFMQYEKEHGKDELNKAVKAGISAFNSTDGDTGTKLRAAVKAFFESEAKDIKTYFKSSEVYGLLGSATTK